MSIKRLAAVFSVASAAALSGCAAYVTPHGRVGVGVAVPPVYVAPAAPVYAPPVYAPPPVYVPPVYVAPVVPRYYAPVPRYYAPRPYYAPHRHW